jgi:hypothetical protein
MPLRKYHDLALIKLFFYIPDLSTTYAEPKIQPGSFSYAAKINLDSKRRGRYLQDLCKIILSING